MPTDRDLDVDSGCANAGISCGIATQHRITDAAAADRFMALTGSATFLVYKEARRNSPLHQQSPGTLYALGADGKADRLTTINNLDIISLVDETLVDIRYHPNSTVGSLLWWKLGTGHHGSVTVFPHGYAPVAAAPGGWVLSKHVSNHSKVAQHLERESTNGSVAKLGNPLTSDADYRVIAGPTGLAAFGDNDDSSAGAVAFLPWAHPTKVTALRGEVGGLEGCSSMTAKYLACSLGDVPKTTMTVFPLSGARPTATTAGCPQGVPALLHGNAAWIAGACGSHNHRHHLVVMNRHGKISTSSRRFATDSPVAAFGRVVVATPSQTKLETITKADSRPQQLLG